MADMPPGPTFDVFGVTVEFLNWRDGLAFYILSGQQEVLIADGNNLEWRTASGGDHVRIPGNVMRAHRDVTDEPAVDLAITTPQLRWFFLEIGTPVEGSLRRRTAEQSAHFVQTSVKYYGYVWGTREENAAVGIGSSPFSN
ncbi:cupin [Mycobacterium sp. 852002-51057_SCH5723018]|uniref:cupin n=1 Tax=Mycobacterium sp. 852002-51057_SCH5723018 TaxID=1834094 RepID=UPI0012E887F1|nr:cupin [Mycobacterium sp. 852002-51057_SCH5723018]